jgi:hypothetical protein
VIYGRILGSTVATHVPVVVGTVHVVLVLLLKEVPYVRPGIQEPSGQVQELLKLAVGVKGYRVAGEHRDRYASSVYELSTAVTDDSSFRGWDFNDAPTQTRFSDMSSTLPNRISSSSRSSATCKGTL